MPHIGAAWTRDSALPGGDYPVDRRDALAAELSAAYRGIAPSLASRLIGAHGTGAHVILAGAERRAGIHQVRPSRCRTG